MLPHSIDSERAVLGALLVDPRLLPTARDRLRPSDFYAEAHQIIFSALGDLEGTVDLLTLKAVLEKRGKLDAVGGPAYLSGLDAELQNLSGFGDYVEIVLDRSARRSIIDVAHEAIRRAAACELTIEELVGLGVDSLIKVAEESRVPAGLVRIGPAIKEVHERSKSADGSRVVGLPTGIEPLDAVMQGILPDDIVIIGGRPGDGKTSLMLQVARTNALNGVPVAIFSLEMTRRALSLWLLSAATGVNGQKIRSGDLTTTERDRLEKSAEASLSLPIWVDDGNVNPAQVRSRLTRLVSEGVKPGIVMLDYAQLMSSAPGGNSENRNQELAAIMRDVVAAARSIGAPLVVTSQLSREAEKRGGRPKKSELRDCGEFEAVAERVLMLWDNGSQTPEDVRSGSLMRTISLVKNRQGATADIETCLRTGSMTFLPVDSKRK